MINFFCDRESEMTSNRLTSQEKAFVVVEFAKTRCARQVQMAFLEIYGRELDRRTPRRLYNVFLKTGSMKEKPSKEAVPPYF